MSTEIRVPTLGESIVDATIASWLKKEGDQVRRGETLVELETDKVNVEISAEQDGVLQKIVKQDGDVVSVGEVVGLIGEGAGAATNGSSASGVAAQAQAPAPAPVQRQSTGALEAMRPSTGGLTQRQTTGALDAQRPPSPLARRIAAEHNLDISQIQGTSPHGRVTKDDVIQYMEQNAQPTAPIARVSSPEAPTAVAVQPQSPPVSSVPTGPAAGAPIAGVSPRREERVRMSRRRQTIAQRLVEAQHTAAMLTTFNEIDMTAIMEVRSRRKDAFKERHNVSLGFMSFFTKAVVGALKAFPRLNAEIQGNEMILKRYYDIGIAVGAEEGLVVPVVRDADSKSFAEIEREIADLAKRARDNKLALTELQGGTFTITNGGVFGSLLSTPILNGPQVGILGMHKIEQRPIALNGQVVIRPMMYVALSYDHRIVDGSEAVRFLVKVKELLEDPEILLLEG
jgi:2-oxoglutarate dehydrogenase E2 component (dihydrolipoamide succinyltransferase)